MPRNFITEYWRRLGNRAAEQQPPATSERQESDRENDSREIAAAVQGVEQQLRAANDENQPNNKRKWGWKKAEVLGIWAAAMVGLAAIILGTIDSARQRGIMQGQISELRDEQRAVVVPDAKVVQFQSGGMYWIVPTFTNAGATQTRDAWANVTFAPVPIKYGKNGVNDVRQLLDIRNATHNRFWLGPKQAIQIDGLSEPIDQWAGYLKSGKYWLTYQGVLEYRDVFKGTKTHIVRFCYSVWRNSAITGASGYGLSQCGGGSNCADEECKK